MRIDIQISCECLNNTPINNRTQEFWNKNIFNPISIELNKQYNYL